MSAEHDFVIAHPVEASTPWHIHRYHAGSTPVVREGLKVMVAAGRAPVETLTDLRAYHRWDHTGDHRDGSGKGGSPLHRHLDGYAVVSGTNPRVIEVFSNDNGFLLYRRSEYYGDRNQLIRAHTVRLRPRRKIGR